MPQEAPTHPRLEKATSSRLCYRSFRPPLVANSRAAERMISRGSLLMSVSAKLGFSIPKRGKTVFLCLLRSQREPIVGESDRRGCCHRRTELSTHLPRTIIRGYFGIRDITAVRVSLGGSRVASLLFSRNGINKAERDFSDLEGLTSGFRVVAKVRRGLAVCVRKSVAEDDQGRRTALGSLKRCVPHSSHAH